MISNKQVVNIPSSPGVYIFRRMNEVLYIGKSVNLKARIKSHIENAKLDSKEKSIINNSSSISYTICDTEFNSLLLESRLIQKYKPKYNSRWLDDKSYLYIKITIGDEYPKILPVRKENDGNSSYFGPFPSLASIEVILRDIRRTFPFCTQKKVGNKPCFYSKIGLCSPCPNFISGLSDKKLRSRQKKIYRSNIRQVIRILNGRSTDVLKELYKQLQDSIRKQDYETAILIRDKILRFERFINHSSYNHTEEKFNRSAEAINSLVTILKSFFPNLSKLDRVECFDVSNISFHNSTASMVVLNNGIIDKSQYRKFKIRLADPRSDLEILSETIKRRFANDWPAPDLIVVDGGKPQVKIFKKALTTLKKNYAIIGIAKNPDRLVVGTSDFPTVKPAINNPGFNMIRNLRDESHRFARKYHLLLRSRNLI